MPISKMFQRALGALHFLTIIRLGNPGPFDAPGMVPYFPIVGLLIGAMVVIADWIGSYFLQSHILAVVDVAFLAILSGALHLDGLADSADGIFSHRGKERALEIMKDSRVGVMGVVVVFLTLALKIAAIAGIQEHIGLWLLMVPALSRSGIIAAMKWLPYGRPQGGTGRAFIDSNLSCTAFRGVIPLLILGLFAGWHGLAILCVFIAITWGLIRFFKYQMDCVTGDMLGAMIEITETLLFTVAAMDLAV
ncbi:MAG: adenosylcobinamide-GDP ribazoletransferase [Desulfobacterales bacterium]